MKIGDKVRLVGPNIYYYEKPDVGDEDNKFYAPGNEGVIVNLGLSESGRMSWYDISIEGSAHEYLTYTESEFEVIE